MIRYWSWPIPDKNDGITYGPIGFIRPECKDDKGLLVHEQTHVKQFWQFLRDFKFRSMEDLEIEAYRAQLEAYGPGHDPIKLAKRLVDNYGFDLTLDLAIILLTI